MNGAAEARSYDRSLSRDERKSGGVFYTPPHIARYIVERALKPLLDECSSVDDMLKLRICDPACGVGLFLEAARDFMLESAAGKRWRIDGRLRGRIESSCLFGVDLDERALRLARRLLPKARLIAGDPLANRGLLEPGGFHAVIGNPPYGAQTGGKGESAQQFMALAEKILHPNGRHAFIVPKAFLYSHRWREARSRLVPLLTEVVDCGRLWPEVRLEQVIYVAARGSQPRYRSRRLVGRRVIGSDLLDKRAIERFGFVLNGVSKHELALGEHILENSVSLHEQVSNRRGEALQARLGDRGVAAFGGKQIGRYSLSAEPKGRIATQVPAGSPAWLRPRSILVQNIVAHVQNPEAHLKIAACMPLTDSPFLILDTVNQLTVHGELPAEIILALLNSKLIAWYLYRFVIGRAIRTIHFDAPITSRIPVPRAIKKSDRERLIGLVREMLRAPDVSIDREIDEVVFDLFGVSSFRGEGVGEGRKGYRGIGV